MLDRVRSPILSVRRVRRANRDQRPRLGSDRVHDAKRLGGEPAEQHGELHGDAHDARVRTRPLQPARDVRRLCHGLPQLALCSITPALRRVHYVVVVLVVLGTDYGDDRAGAVSHERVEPAEPEPARIRGHVHSRAAVRRGVQRRGPRVPTIPRLPVPAPAVHGEPELWSGFRGRGRGGRRWRGPDGRRHGPMGERVVQWARGCVSAATNLDLVHS